MAMSKIKDNLETKESDEIHEMFCEHCDNEGKYAVAHGFCVNCNEFMCSVCLKYHNKYKSEHVTQDKDHMPQDYCDKRESTFKVTLDSVRKDVSAMKLQVNPAVSYRKSVQQSNRESDQVHIAVHKYDLNVGNFGWILDGNVTNICMHNSFLIAVVSDCETIVLIDSVLRIKLSELEVSTRPGEAASISENRIIITLPNRGKLLFLCISDAFTLKQKSAMKVGKGCCGIAYSKIQDCLYVSYREPKSKVTILKETGELLGVLDKDLLGNTMFISPENLTLSMDERSLYVSDYGREMVIKLNTDRQVEAVYKDKDLKTPRGITIDENGSVYVCDASSNNILQLNSNLSKIGISVGSADLSYPVSVAICKCGTSEFLYAGMCFNNKIKVFALS